MEKRFECGFVSLFEVLQLQLVGVGRQLRILPPIHKLIGVFRIVGGQLPVDKIPFRNLIVSWLVPAQLRLHQEAVSSAVPGHITGFVTIRHANNFIL